MYKRYHDVKALLVGMEAASAGQSSRQLTGASGGVASASAPGSAASATAVAGTATGGADGTGSADGSPVLADSRYVFVFVWWHGCICGDCEVRFIAWHRVIVARVACRSDDAASGLQASLKALQREKRTLQLQLRKYEDDFQQLHGRKVKYQKDIYPVADDYQRYKVHTHARTHTRLIRRLMFNDFIFC